MELPVEKYIREHSTKQEEALAWIQKQTNIRTKYPRMLSGSMQGRLLKILVELIKPSRILEIGAFTGYSTVCMALGLKENWEHNGNNVQKPIIDSLELNDELLELIEEGFEKAGVTDYVQMHIGDAKETLKSFRNKFAQLSNNEKEAHKYDIVFMDANKREYCEYYDLYFELVKPGGLIIADDVLWDGKVYEEPMPQDKQTVGIDNFNKKAAADERTESVILPIRDGINLIRKIRD